MVTDRLENAASYYGMGKGIETALKYFEAYRDDGKDLPEETQLDGERIYVMGLNYVTGGEGGDTELEAHRKYVDVMYVVEGEEMFYYKPFSKVSEITVPYDPADECAMAALDGDCARVRFQQGQFLIFLPQDAHLAAQLWERPCKVRKFIAKVGVDTL